MKIRHFFRLIGLMVALAAMTWGLLALNPLNSPSGAVRRQSLDLDARPLIAAPAEGTPEPQAIAPRLPGGSNDGNCTTPLVIACGGQDSRNNGGYNSEHDTYGCIGWDESGPEVIYSFTLAAGGNYTVTAQLSNMTADLDLFLLASGGCVAGDCLTFDSYGDNTARASNVPPGTYFIAVDGYQGALSDYTLDLTCVQSSQGNNPPNKPSAPSPAHGATGVDLKPRLSWIGGDPDGDSVHYTVWGQKAIWVTSTIWYSGTNTLFNIGAPLKPSTKYYWNVDAQDSKGAISQGDFWEFTTRAEKRKVFLPLVLKKWSSSGPGPVTDTPTPTSTSTPTSTPSPSPSPTLEARTATRFVNYTPYLIVSLKIDGVEYINSEVDSIPTNYYWEKDLAVGNHNLDAYNGWWEQGNRVFMYRWPGSFQQQAGQMTLIEFRGPPIEQLLPNFQTSRYWRGEYWTGYPVTLHHASFCFYDNNKFRFYIDEQQDDTGTYSELYRSPGLVTFRVTNGAESFDGVLDEIDGSFMMDNGPPDWKNIKYIPDDTVTCPASP